MKRKSVTILQPLPKSSATDICTPAFDKRVWFQSAASGMWYEVKNAGGDISAVKIDGVIYKRKNS